MRRCTRTVRGRESLLRSRARGWSSRQRGRVHGSDLIKSAIENLDGMTRAEWAGSVSLADEHGRMADIVVDLVIADVYQSRRGDLKFRAEMLACVQYFIAAGVVLDGEGGRSGGEVYAYGVADFGRWLVGEGCAVGVVHDTLWAIAKSISYEWLKGVCAESARNEEGIPVDRVGVFLSALFGFTKNVLELLNGGRLKVVDSSAQ